MQESDRYLSKLVIKESNLSTQEYVYLWKWSYIFEFYPMIQRWLFFYVLVDSWNIMGTNFISNNNYLLIVRI